MLAAIHHRDTGLRLAAERAFLERLDGSCQTPIAGLAVLEGDSLWLRGEILRPDGSRCVTGDLRGPSRRRGRDGPRHWPTRFWAAPGRGSLA